MEETAYIFVTETIRASLFRYRIDNGDYPTAEEGLNALIEAPENGKEKWKGPYVEELWSDPWGNAYQYKYPSEKENVPYQIWSLGPDGVPSQDDIGNWMEINSESKKSLIGLPSLLTIILVAVVGIYWFRRRTSKQNKLRDQIAGTGGAID